MPESVASLLLRPATPADLPRITAIYAHWVRHSAASFEIDPPDEREIRRRFDALADAGFPFLVTEDPVTARVIGYAYAGPYRTRPAYRFAVEDSIYVAPDNTRKGVGTTLLAALVHAAERRGARLMVAVIGDSANAASIALHQRCGFAPAGKLPLIGWKHGRWIDSVMMTRPLGAGAATPPE